LLDKTAANIRTSSAFLISGDEMFYTTLTILTVSKMLPFKVFQEKQDLNIPKLLITAAQIFKWLLLINKIFDPIAKFI